MASSVAPFAFLFVFVLFFSLSLSQSLACHFLLAKQNKYVLAVGITCITYTIRGTTAIYATRMPKKHTHTHTLKPVLHLAFTCGKPAKPHGSSDCFLLHPLPNHSFSLFHLFSTHVLNAHYFILIESLLRLTEATFPQPNWS